jgi:signal transduction histidine kinase
VAENGESLLAPDVRKEPRFRPSALEATQSELAVAVRLGGETVAVINVESDVRGAFDEGDLVAIDGIASQIAGALRNARLFEDKLRALRNLEILQETTNVLNSDLDLDALLARIARRSVEAVPAADRGALLLFEDEELRVRSSWGYPHPGFLARVHLGFHQGLPGSVFVSGKGRLTTGSADTEDPAFADAAGGVPARSALCVPVFLPQEKLGVLLLESDKGAQAFEPADLRFAATLADQAAIAIGNALRLRRMEEMDKHRKAYLSNVSHELRTPLTVIQGYLEALVPLVKGDDPQRLAQTALEQAHRLGRRIDEILEVTRLETGVAQRHLEWSPVKLGDTVRSVVQSLRHEATISGVTLVSEIDETVPVLPGEERLLHLMVLNIVENAVKFTSAGGRVTVSLSERAGHAVLRVTDDGIGIPPELVERVFEKFFMADAGPTKARGGAGIGLYLVREVVQIHDGTISVGAAPGRGTSFEVALPIRPLA